jgi:hypothetical protein
VEPAPPLDFDEVVAPAPPPPEELPPLLLELLPPFPALAELPPDEVLPPEADVETDPAVADPPAADELEADDPPLPAPLVAPPV